MIYFLSKDSNRAGNKRRSTINAIKKAKTEKKKAQAEKKKGKKKKAKVKNKKGKKKKAKAKNKKGKITLMNRNFTAKMIISVNISKY